MGGSGPDERGTVVDVPAVLGMGHVGPLRRVHGAVGARTRWTCVKRRRGRSATGSSSLVMVADRVLAVEARGDLW